MPVEMLLSRVVINEGGSDQVIYLCELDGERELPILIGVYEATSITRRLRRLPAKRPLTHDVIITTALALGGNIQDVVINDLHDDIFFAHLRILTRGNLLTIDSRPSDAIVIAIGHDPPLPIFVEENVLSEVCGSAKS